jgi:tetratricopeptide (TPR) repeat protein
VGSPISATPLANLGKLAFLQKRDGPAEAFLKRAITAYERAGGGDAELASPLENLGDLRLRQGKLRRALARYGRALAIREKAQGAAHPLVGALAGKIGRVWMELREPARALPFLDRAVGLLEKAPHLRRDLAEARALLASCNRERK